MKNLFPILTVVAAIVVLWYGAAVWLNAPWAYDKAQRADITLSTSGLIADTWSQKKPKLPAPHQVTQEIWKTTAEKKITSKKDHLETLAHLPFLGHAQCHAPWLRARCRSWHRTRGRHRL